MPCLPTTTAITVAVPTPCISATTVVPLAITLPYVSARGPSASAALTSKVTTMVEVTEVLEAPGTSNHPGTVTGPGAEDSAPATPQVGSHITTGLPIASPSHSASPHQLDLYCCWCTPFWYSQDSLEVIPADIVKTSSHPKGSLLTETVSDRQVSFYTRLQLPTKNGMKLMTIKIDPGAQVDTIPLSRYQKLLPPKVNETRYPKPNSCSSHLDLSWW